MANTHTNIITLLLLLISLNGMSKDTPVSMPASTWFVENAGQVTGPEGKIAANVLYTIEQPGVTIYLTTTGLTYVFLKSLAEEEEMRKAAIQPEEREPEKQEFIYERFDLELAGASITGTKIIRTGKHRIITIITTEVPTVQKPANMPGPVLPFRMCTPVLIGCCTQMKTGQPEI